MWEQLFHAWRSFHYSKITETLDTYVTRIRQVAALLGYGEPQILEVLKNILPNRLYRVLFLIDDLRLAVETAKRILTEEKIDRQLPDKSGMTTPFMKVSGNHSSTSKRQYWLTPKAGWTRKLITLPQWLVNWQLKLTKETHNSSPKYTKGRGEDKPGMAIIIKLTTGLEIDLLVEIEGHCIVVEVDLDKIMTGILGNIIEGDCKTFIETTRGEKITEDKIIEIEVEVETIPEAITGMTIDGTIILVETDVRWDKDDL